MEYVTRNQIRMFRLRHHHLDRYYHKADVYDDVGACGIQNTPPEIWQAVLSLRILCAHDPYLDLKDRDVILSFSTLHKAIWKIVSNLGVILYEGKIIGFWKQMKQKHTIRYKVHIWKEMQNFHSVFKNNF